MNSLSLYYSRRSHHSWGQPQPLCWGWPCAYSDKTVSQRCWLGCVLLNSDFFDEDNNNTTIHKKYKQTASWYLISELSWWVHWSVGIWKSCIKDWFGHGDNEMNSKLVTKDFNIVITVFVILKSKWFLNHGFYNRLMLKFESYSFWLVFLTKDQCLRLWSCHLHWHQSWGSCHGGVVEGGQMKQLSV